MLPFSHISSELTFQKHDAKCNKIKKSVCGLSTNSSMYGSCTHSSGGVLWVWATKTFPEKMPEHNNPASVTGHAWY